MEDDPISLSADLARNIGAVSYTHLDVYKRQITDMPVLP